jgi:Zn-dependent protease
VEPIPGHRIDPALPAFPAIWNAPARQSHFSWSLLAAAAAIVLAIRLFGREWLQIFQSAGIRRLDELTVLFAAMIAAVAVHELGHLAMALALDFDVLGGSLGPIRAIRLHGAWSFQFSWNLFSGSVIAIPRSDSNWRARMLAVVAGGPISTFLAGLAAALLLLAFGISHSLLARFAGAFVQLNFFVFVLGLLPNAPAARLPNDARLFFSFLRNTPEANEILLYHLCTQLQIAGVRPRDYPERLIRKLAKARGRPEMCFVYANAIALWAADRGDVLTADAWEKRALDLSDFCGLKLQNFALAASACFDVIFRDDVRAARGKFAEVRLGTLSPPWLQYRIAAAYWVSAGNVPAALAEIARARYSFPTRLPYYDFERMLLTSLHRKAIATQPVDLARHCVNRLTGPAGV